MPEFMPQGEINTASGPDRIVVKDAPPFLAGGRAIQSAIKTRKILAKHANDRIVRKLLRGEFFRDTRYVDWKVLRSQHGV